MIAWLTVFDFSHITVKKIIQTLGIKRAGSNNQVSKSSKISSVPWHFRHFVVNACMSWGNKIFLVYVVTGPRGPWMMANWEQFKLLSALVVRYLQLVMCSAFLCIAQSCFCDLPIIFPVILWRAWFSLLTLKLLYQAVILNVKILSTRVLCAISSMCWLMPKQHRLPEWKQVLLSSLKYARWDLIKSSGLICAKVLKMFSCAISIHRQCTSILDWRNNFVCICFKLSGTKSTRNKADS